MRLLSSLFLTLSMIFSTNLRAEGFDVKDGCDMPSVSIKETRTATREECQKLCADDKDCKAVLYISGGWKKCALKADPKKHARLQFESGELDGKHAYQTGSFKTDFDHNGKDIEKVTVDKADACGEACAAKPECAAFAYLDGYRTCWLKKPGGHLHPKVFSCSFKKD